MLGWAQDESPLRKWHYPGKYKKFPISHPLPLLAGGKITSQCWNNPQELDWTSQYQGWGRLFPPTAELERAADTSSPGAPDKSEQGTCASPGPEKALIAMGQLAGIPGTRAKKML